MKHSRFVKLTSTARGPVDLVLEQSRNPLRKDIEVKQASHALTKTFIQDFKTSFNLSAASQTQPYVVVVTFTLLVALSSNNVHSLLCEKPTSGWLTWGKTANVFQTPDRTKPTFLPWSDACKEGINVYRELTMKESFWKKLAKHYSSENHAEVITQDHVSCVKSICEYLILLVVAGSLKGPWHVVQLLDDGPLPALKPVMEELLGNKDKNKQRGAAEFLAGVLSGQCSRYLHTVASSRIDQVQNIGPWIRNSLYGTGSSLG